MAAGRNRINYDIKLSNLQHTDSLKDRDKSLLSRARILGSNKGFNDHLMITEPKQSQRLDLMRN